MLIRFSSSCRCHRGVPSSNVRAYMEMCSGSRAKMASTDSCHASMVWSGRPKIKSRFRFLNPAFRIIPTARSACSKVCSRFSRDSSSSWADCTPMEMRFTPPWRRVRSRDGVTLSGFTSTVISQSLAR